MNSKHIWAPPAIPAPAEGLITAASQHGCSLKELGLGGGMTRGSTELREHPMRVWMRGAINVLPLFGFQNLLYLAFPRIQKLWAKSCRNWAVLKKSTPNKTFHWSGFCFLSVFLSPLNVAETGFSITMRVTHLPLKNYEISWGTDKKPGDRGLGFGCSWRRSH